MKPSPLINDFNVALANLHILGIKLHNYHWNICGDFFEEVHEKTEEYYDQMFKWYDEVAERILQLGGKPLATAADYLQKATLKEETATSFELRSAYTPIAEDFEAINTLFGKIRTKAEKIGDAVTADMLTVMQAWLQKELWILKATLKK